MHANTPAPEPFMHYVPGELCVMVAYRGDGSAGDGDDGSSGKLHDALYNAVRIHLLGRLLRALDRERDEQARDEQEAAGEQADDPQVRDILARELRLDKDSIAFFAREKTLLNSLYDKKHRPRAGATDHRIILPAARQETATALLFYRIGAVPIRLDAPDIAARLPHALRLTRDLVNLAYRDIARQSESWVSGGGFDFQIRSVMPNWLLGAAQISSDSPGAKPEPLAEERPGRWTFRFASDPTMASRSDARKTQRQLDNLVEQHRQKPREESPTPITVAILDTCPDLKIVEQAVEDHEQNLLLRDVKERVKIEPANNGLARTEDSFAHLVGCHLNLGWPPAAPDHDFPQADHGLFVAGIVADIAPHADIHLIRVLNDHGIGDMRAIANVVKGLPERFLRKSPDSRLVVNLSLVADVPSGMSFLEMWLPETARAVRRRNADGADLQTALSDYPDVRRVLDTLHQGLADLIGWLRDQRDANGQSRVLLVAASGNDHDPHAKPVAPTVRRREPRWPARYDMVFGVAAVAGRLQAAEYSNRGDAFTLGNGVATFGGNAKRAALGMLPAIDVTPAIPGEVDAVRGIYSARRLPPDAHGVSRPNTSGWVYWAGTSFAAPIISAIAALVWAEHPQLPPGGPRQPDSIVGKVLAYVSSTAPSSDPDRLDCPAIFARQMFIDR